MRWLLMVLLVLAGCHGPGGEAEIEVNPGPATPQPLPTPATTALRVCPDPTAYLDVTPLPVAHATDSQPIPKDTPLDLRVHVAGNPGPAIDAFIADVVDPKSPRFGKYLTPEQYRERFGPNNSQLASAIAHLSGHGLTVSRVHGAALHVQGPLGAAEKAFGTEIRSFVASDGTRLMAPVQSIAALPGYKVVHVHGLSTMRQPINYSQPAPRVAGGYIPATLRRAYGIPNKADGAGQSVGIITFGGYSHEDIYKYSDIYGLPRPTLLDIGVNGYTPAPSNDGGQIETTLDVSLVHAMAPRLKQIRVYADWPKSTHGLFDLLNEIANPSQGDRQLMKVISCSWGRPEGWVSPAFVAAENTFFRQMAAQGQTFLAASGDNGARDDGSRLGTDDPASQPYVLAVGGTTLTTDIEGNWQSETTWAGSGGGVSCFWKQPPWQVSIVPPLANGEVVGRSVPDVALNADFRTGYSIIVNNQMYVFGGTSAAAPLWAGFLANVHKLRGARPPLGFAVPALYKVAQTPRGRLGFRDISDRSTNGFYSAVEGYDEATGWGTIAGWPLIHALVDY